MARGAAAILLLVAMGAHNSQPKADPKNSNRFLKSHNSGPWFLQDGVDAIVAELRVPRKSRFERGLDFYSWVPRKSDLVFNNLET